MIKSRFAFIADIHYYSESLGSSGRAYELRSGADQKCLAESGAVTDMVLQKLAASSVDAVMIAGDLTNDGELCSHLELKEKLIKFSEKKPLYLITSTHDWCSDNNARRFQGEKATNDVETVSPQQLNNMYADFGEKAIASFETSKGFFSRVFQVADNIRLIAVNDDCDGANGKSGYSEAHLEWMTQQIKAAKDENNFVIAMQHHLVLHNISPLINSGQSIADNYYVAERLADAGLRLLFVGHSHMQRTTRFVTKNGNPLTQVNLGSLCGYPSPITYITVENGVAKAEVEFSDGFTYNGEYYGADFFEKHTSNVLLNLLNSAVSDKNDFFERLAADGIKPKGAEKLYPVIKKAAEILLNVKVGKAAKTVNFFTFGKAVKKENYKPVKDEPLLPHVLDTFLNVFDGSFTASKQSEYVKRTVCDVGSLPDRAVRFLPVKKAKKEKIYKITGQIRSIANELCYPSSPDNMVFEVELNT